LDLSTATLLSTEWLDVSDVSWTSFVGWLSAAFVLGLVHAFDADHVMVLSVFASRRRGARAGAYAGFRWSLGHGVVLLIVGIGMLFLGRSLSPQAAAFAERAVGVVMVLLGAYAGIDLARGSRHLHFHDHEDLPSHAHWHAHENVGHGHEHGAMMVGALHGLAGSAPILAVLPAAARSPLLGIAYLMIFGIGVALAMSVVSGLLGHLAGRLASGARATGLTVMRGLSAAGSIALGAWLVALA
jgi:ABC-type nickel/cobalt efflux system permease component RcnA